MQVAPLPSPPSGSVPEVLSPTYMVGGGPSRAAQEAAGGEDKELRSVIQHSVGGLGWVWAPKAVTRQKEKTP